MSKRLRVGDQVIVISGNDRGRSGKILRKDDKRVVVEGVNIRKKHMRPTRENQKGQIVEFECPVAISNVRLSIEGSPVKLRARWNEAGDKEYYYQDGQEQIRYRKVRK